MNKKFWIPKFNYYSKRLSVWQEKLWREANGKPFMGIIDNVAGRKTFEYATFGRSGVQQSNSKLFTTRPEPIVMPPQQMTAVCVWNASNAIIQAPALETQIDRGQGPAFDSTPEPTSPQLCYPYGYNATGEGYLASWGNIGTMDDVTYTDGGSTSRTIKSVMYTEVCDGGIDDTFYFSIDTTSVSNSDTTWKDITWDDVGGTPRLMDRSVDTTTYDASVNGSTHWRDEAAPWNWSDTDANTDFVLTTG